MAADRRMVSVSHERRISALEEPRFLLEAGGKLYLTVAVLEYDPRHPGITGEQSRAIADLQGFMKKAPRTKAACFPSSKVDNDLICANTSVPPELPGPID